MTRPDDLDVCPNCEEELEWCEGPAKWVHRSDRAGQFDCYSDGALLEYADSLDRANEYGALLNAMAEVVRRGLAESPRRRAVAKEEHRA